MASFNVQFAPQAVIVLSDAAPHYPCDAVMGKVMSAVLCTGLMRLEPRVCWRVIPKTRLRGIDLQTQWAVLSYETNII